MWIMTTDGFFSAVQNKDDPKTVLIRARRRDDLERLNKYIMGDNKIMEWAGADYPYRIIIKKSIWADYVSNKALNISYSNFKATIPVGDYSREKAYHECWVSLMGLEEESA